MNISEGVTVALEYTLKDEKGTFIESNVGAKPLVYTHGTSQIIPGLEKGLEALKAGDSTIVTVRPEEAYGAVDENAYLEIPLERIPEDARQIGARLQTTDRNGQVLHPAVAKIKEDVVVLDFNHPLAGKTLHFTVKVLEVQQPSA